MTDKFEGTSGIIALPEVEYKQNNQFDPVPVEIGEEVNIDVYGTVRDLNGEHYRGFVVAVYEENMVDIELIIENAVFIVNSVPWKVPNGTYKQGLYWSKME